MHIVVYHTILKIVLGIIEKHNPIAAANKKLLTESLIFLSILDKWVLVISNILTSISL